MSSEPDNPLNLPTRLLELDIVAVDPGDTSGWIRFQNGRLRLGLWFGEKEPGREINSEPPQILVVENYLIRPPKMTRGKFTHAWNKASAIRIIGSLQTVADLRDLKFELQEPSIKPVGYGWAGLTYVKGKQGTHIQDAASHLAHFMYKKLKVPIDTIRAIVSGTVPDTDKVP